MSTYAYNQLVTAIEDAREDVLNDSWADTDEQMKGINAFARRIAAAISADDPKFDSKAFFAETRTHVDVV